MVYATVGAIQLRRAGWRVEWVLFGIGWGGFPSIALAVWLSWGGGRIAIRLLAVLGLAAITCGFTAYSQYGLSPEMRLRFLESLLSTLAQILILHALAYPLRKTLRWQLTFRQSTTPAAAARLNTRWSLLEALGWTAFAAMALAMVRLHSMFLNNTQATPQPLSHWLNFITQSVPCVVSFPFIAWAVWGQQLGLIRRVILIAVALAAAFCCEQGALLMLSGILRPTYTAATASGLVASALVHCSAMRVAGVRWGWDDEGRNWSRGTET